MTAGGFVERVGPEAAPGRGCGSAKRSPVDRISVDVAQLFHAFVVGVDIEVVVAWLPDVLLGPCTGEALFEDLYARWKALLVLVR